jgi:aminoglycoside 6-adenylyltransferase
VGEGGCDGYLKNLLRQVLEWQAQACRGGKLIPGCAAASWRSGADPRAVEALPRIFAHYDTEDVWRALVATMDLFRWLAVETAERLGYSYPASGAAHAAELVEVLLPAGSLARGSGPAS